MLEKHGVHKEARMSVAKMYSLNRRNIGVTSNRNENTYRVGYHNTSVHQSLSLES